MLREFVLAHFSARVPYIIALLGGVPRSHTIIFARDGLYLLSALIMLDDHPPKEGNLVVEHVRDGVQVLGAGTAVEGEIDTAIVSSGPYDTGCARPEFSEGIGAGMRGFRTIEASRKDVAQNNSLLETFVNGHVIEMGCHFTGLRNPFG